MKAVYIKEFGGPEVLEIRDVAEPSGPIDGQVLVNVKAAGLNRADYLQRRGVYPPPAGYSPNIPGLEFAGEVVEVGPAVARFQKGDRVFGITAGEAQAEFLLADESHLAAIPENLSYTEAAAIPEVFITAHDAVFTQAGISSGDALLVHAVGSGVGLAALQLGKANGVRVIGTSRTADKIDRCAAFGLDTGIVVEDDSGFADQVLDATHGKGVDVILDLAGGSYFDQNLKCLAEKGRLMLVGLPAGSSAEIDLRIALTKRLSIIGTVLRSRSDQEKAAVTRAFEEQVVPHLATGAIKPNIDRVFEVGQVQEAHRYLESGESFGKVVLEF